MSTIRFSRSATCFFSPRGCCTIVTNSPMIALPSASISGLNPNGASSAAVARTATSAKSRSSSARKKRSGSSGSNVTSQRPAVDAVLEVELDHARRSRVSASGSTWWLVSSSARGDERARAEADVAADRVADPHAADGPRGGHARVEVARADEVRGEDDLLEQLLRPRPVGDRRVAVVTREPVDALGDALRRIRGGEAAGARERGRVLVAALRPLLDAAGRSVALALALLLVGLDHARPP